MGTETSHRRFIMTRAEQLVKLNNPLMGTETNAVLMSTTVVVCFC